MKDEDYFFREFEISKPRKPIKNKYFIGLFNVKIGSIEIKVDKKTFIKALNRLKIDIYSTVRDLNVDRHIFILDDILEIKTSYTDQEIEVSYNRYDLNETVRTYNLLFTIKEPRND